MEEKDLVREVPAGIFFVAGRADVAFTGLKNSIMKVEHPMGPYMIVSWDGVEHFEETFQEVKKLVGGQIVPIRSGSLYPLEGDQLQEMSRFRVCYPNYVTIMALRIFGVDLTQFLQQDHPWKLFDCGPNVEIDTIYAHAFDDSRIHAFKAFISDVDVEAPKRGNLKITRFENPQMFHSIFRAITDVFLGVTRPAKLFQKIEVDFRHATIDQLAYQVQADTKWVCRSLHYQNRGFIETLRVFRMDHPKWKKLAMDMRISESKVQFNLIHL